MTPDPRTQKGRVVLKRHWEALTAPTGIAPRFLLRETWPAAELDGVLAAVNALPELLKIADERDALEAEVEKLKEHLLMLEGFMRDAGFVPPVLSPLVSVPGVEFIYHPDDPEEDEWLKSRRGQESSGLEDE